MTVQITGEPNPASNHFMEQPVPPPEKRRGQTSPLLFFIILGIIIAGLLSFIILRPN